MPDSNEKPLDVEAMSDAELADMRRRYSTEQWAGAPTVPRLLATISRQAARIAELEEARSLAQSLQTRLDAEEAHDLERNRQLVSENAELRQGLEEARRERDAAQARSLSVEVLETLEDMCAQASVHCVDDDDSAVATDCLMAIRAAIEKAREAESADASGLLHDRIHPASGALISSKPISRKAEGKR